MVLILEDEHLESLQCSRCRKYLSVFPVKNHPNREVTCGRCSGIDADTDDSVRSALYELIAEKYLFKCVNRFEGCRKLLRADETEAHEARCVGNRFVCPKCEDGKGMTVLELIWHYKLRHPTSYFKKNYFKGKVPVKDVMLYIHDEVVFFILFEYDSSLNTLYFGAVTLTGANASETFIISQGSVFKITEKKSCDSINTLDRGNFKIILNSVELIKVIFNLEVSKGAGLYEVSMPSTSKVENTTQTVLSNILFPYTAQLMSELPEKYSEYKWASRALVNGAGHEIDLTCSNCKLIIGLPVYRCIKSRHQLCYSCHTWCSTCECSVVKSFSNDVLLEISPYLNLLCKWNCGEYFNSSDLRAHEGVCELRIKKCPKCSSNVHLKLMKNHLLGEHKKYFLAEYDVEEVMDFIYNNKTGYVYFLLNNRWCGFEWELVSDQQYDLWFDFIESISNAKLCVIPSNFIIIPAECKKLDLHDISACKPYLKFIHN